MGTAATIMFLVLSGATLFAMGRSGQVPPDQGTVAAPAASAPTQNKATIKDILSDPVKFSSAEVVLEGIFKGWDGTCPSSSMLTRSDWILEDETGCIYVTGRIPTGLSPMQPHSERIVVTGRVMVSETGKPIIKASQFSQILEDVNDAED